MNNTKGFWDGLGFALVILAILLGFGGCAYLEQAGIAKRQKQQCTCQEKLK